MPFHQVQSTHRRPMKFPLDILRAQARVNVFPLSRGSHETPSDVNSSTECTGTSNLTSTIRRNSFRLSERTRFGIGAMLAVVAILACPGRFTARAGAQAVNNAQVHGVVQDSTFYPISPSASIRSTSVQRTSAILSKRGLNCRLARTSPSTFRSTSVTFRRRYTFPPMRRW